MLKLTLDHLICALCYAIRPYFKCLLNLSGPSLHHPDKSGFSALTTLARASISAHSATDLLKSNILQSVVENVEKSCRKFTGESKKVSSSSELSLRPGKATEETEAAVQELRGMLEFLTTCLDHPVLKQWLGGEDGNSFWHSLLAFLADSHPRISISRRHYLSDDSSFYVPICPRLLTSLQTTVLKFFKKCVSGHLKNQRCLAHVLRELLARGNGDVAQGVETLSGFVRRLVLELLLGEDHVVLAVTCAGAVSQGMVTSCGSATQSPLWHPRFGASNTCRLLRVRVNTTMFELVGLLVATPLPQLPKVSSGTNDSSRRTSEGLQDLMELLEFSDLSKHEVLSLTSSAVNVKSKRNQGDKEKVEASVTESSVDRPPGGLPSETWMYCEDGPLAGIPLPKETTVGQIMESLLQQGQQMGTISIRLGLRSPADHVAKVTSGSSSVNDLTNLKPSSTLLEVFSELGGLALIADRLPPRFSVAMSSTSAQVVSASPLYSPVVMTSAIPGHSLMGFTMFLRLPGYAKIFLENQQNARFMLRLILGVEDDGEGGVLHFQEIKFSRHTKFKGW